MRQQSQNHSGGATEPLEDISDRLRRCASRRPQNLRAEALAAAERLVAAGARTVQGLVSALMHGDAGLRYDACDAIGYLGRKRLASNLVDILACRSESRELRSTAAWSLGVLKSRASVPRLIAVLSAGSDPAAREYAAYALGWIRDRRGLAPLLTVLRQPSAPPAVRAQAAHSVVLLGDHAAVPALVDCLGDSHPEVRFFSVYALGELPEAATVAALRPLARDDHDEVPGWGSIATEAKRVIRALRRRQRMLAGNTIAAGPSSPPRGGGPDAPVGGGGAPVDAAATEPGDAVHLAPGRIGHPAA